MRSPAGFHSWACKVQVNKTAAAVNRFISFIQVNFVYTN
jgi:hypothetical protein